jgi:hypothetical protein
MLDHMADMAMILVLVGVDLVNWGFRGSVSTIIS